MIEKILNHSDQTGQYASFEDEFWVSKEAAEKMLEDFRPNFERFIDITSDATYMRYHTRRQLCSMLAAMVQAKNDHNELPSEARLLKIRGFGSKSLFAAKLSGLVIGHALSDLSPKTPKEKDALMRKEKIRSMIQDCKNRIAELKKELKSL